MVRVQATSQVVSGSNPGSGADKQHYYGCLRRSRVLQTSKMLRDVVNFVCIPQCVILAHAVSSGQTVNAQYYCSFLEYNLRPTLREKRWHFCRSHALSFMTMPGRIQHKICHICMLPWCGKCFTLSDIFFGLKPRDFDLNTKMKEPLRGTCFDIVSKILKIVDRSILRINSRGAAGVILQLQNVGSWF